MREAGARDVTMTRMNRTSDCMRDGSLSPPYRLMPAPAAGVKAAVGQSGGQLSHSVSQTERQAAAAAVAGGGGGCRGKERGAPSDKICYRHTVRLSALGGLNKQPQSGRTWSE